MRADNISLDDVMAVYQEFLGAAPDEFAFLTGTPQKLLEIKSTFKSVYYINTISSHPKKNLFLILWIFNHKASTPFGTVE